MIDFGEGVPPKDNVQAYKWLSLAVRDYTAKNQGRLDQATKDLAAVRARMSPAQIADAERQIRDFQPIP